MTLYLLPNLLAPVSDHHTVLPASVDQVVASIDGLIAESEGEGRRFLKRFQTKKKPHEMPISLLRDHTSTDGLDFLLDPVKKGENWGVVSDAGLPCVADPGSALVQRAHKRKIPVQALVGPSSIMLALMLSGITHQRFTFHSYLPKKPDERKKMLQNLEKTPQMTHIFIEAPYRNAHTYKDTVGVLKPRTLLCVATQLTSSDQWIHTALISDWQKMDGIEERIAKKPTIFLIAS